MRNKRSDENGTLDLSDVQQKDLVKYGLMPELIGRLHVVCTLNSLSKNDLKSILVQPKNAIIKQYQELFKMNNVDLIFSEEALDRMAEKAILRNMGARGLRSILEKSMRDLMFEIPDQSDVEKIIITDDFIDGKADALIYKNFNEKTA